MFALLVLLLACTASFSGAVQENSNEALAKPNQLFFLSGGELWRVDIENEKARETLVISANVSDFVLDESRNRLLWIDQSGQIFYRRISGKSIDKLASKQKFLELPRMSFDPINNNFYVYDRAANASKAIRVVDWRGKTRAIWQHPNLKPIQVVVEPRVGLIFILADETNPKSSTVNRKCFRLKIGDSFDSISPVSRRYIPFFIDEISVDPESKRLFVNDEITGNFRSGTFDSSALDLYTYHNYELALDCRKCHPGHNTFSVYNSQIFWTSYTSSKIKIFAASARGEEARVFPLSHEYKEAPRSLKVVKSPNLCMDEKLGCRAKRQVPSDNLDYLYTQQPTLRPEPQAQEPDTGIPIYILYPGK